MELRQAIKLGLFNDTYSIRFGVDLGSPWVYNLLWYHVIPVIGSNKFCNPKIVSIVKVPKVKQIFQGELTRNQYGLYLYASEYPDVMRVALEKAGREYTNLAAKFMLEKYVDASSYDWLMELLEEYPDHVIEFTVFDNDVGIIPHRNTVIWEVRYY
jgi:hypothetical protein